MNKHPILVVDDDLISRLLNCAILRDCGFEVLEAGSTVEARRVLETGLPVAALVTAIELGSPTGGIKLAWRAQAANGRIPVVYLGCSDLLQNNDLGVQNSVCIATPSDPLQIVWVLDEMTPLAPARSG